MVSHLLYQPLILIFKFVVLWMSYKLHRYPIHPVKKPKTACMAINRDPLRTPKVVSRNF